MVDNDSTTSNSDRKNIKISLHTCTICAKSFLLKNSLQVHYKSHYKEITKKNDKENLKVSSGHSKSPIQKKLTAYYQKSSASNTIKFTCYICPLDFTDKNNLYKHLLCHILNEVKAGYQLKQHNKLELSAKESSNKTFTQGSSTAHD